MLEAGSAQCCRRVLCYESVGWFSARRWELECYSAQTKVDGAKRSVARTMMNRRQPTRRRWLWQYLDGVQARQGYSQDAQETKLRGHTADGNPLHECRRGNRYRCSHRWTCCDLKNDFHSRCRLTKWHSKASQRVWAH